MPLKPEEKLIGKTFEKCRILAKLGTGGMGSVYLAEHFGLGRKVAVKILPADMSRDPEYVARFMREATTAGRMEHPNIVQIHDVGYAEGRHFIVMQYVDGESLSTVVDELGAMEPRDAAQLAVGILRGLQHAHEQLALRVDEREVVEIVVVEAQLTQRRDQRDLPQHRAGGVRSVGGEGAVQTCRQGHRPRDEDHLESEDRQSSHRNVAVEQLHVRSAESGLRRSLRKSPIPQSSPP
jgi:hypothetical protein